jgi:DNA-binding MarR family transcriptional regulator
MATRWLTPQEMAAWRTFIVTTGDLTRAIERDLHQFDLDLGDYQLLAMLSEAPEQRLKMCDLADSLRLTRSGLTRRMDGVLKKKLVTRTQSSEDGRVAYAQISAKGIEVLKTAAPHHLDSVRAHMIDLLSPTEIKAIASAFKKISQKLSDDKESS